MKKLQSMAALAAVMSMVVPVAQATNGYMAHGYGTKNKGMAGAGSAMPQDAMSAANNVAGMAWVGKRLDVGLSLFNPNREYTQRATQPLNPNMGLPAPLPIGSNADGTGTVESGMNWFLIPHFAYAQPVGEAGTVGATLYGNGGMNATYDADETMMGLGTFLSQGRTEVDLSQLALNLSYAQKFDERFSLGVGLITSYQMFKAEGLQPLGDFGLVADGNPGNLSNNGSEGVFGWGVQLGAMWKVNDQWSLAAAYQSKIDYEKFDKYSDLFANQGDLDAPAFMNLGVAYHPNDRLSLAFDVQHIWYSDVAALGNPMTSSLERCMAGESSYCLGGDHGAGFGWEDMTVYKLGVQYALQPDLTLRAGYSYGNQPVPSSGVLFNVLAPAVIEQHFTLGLTKQFNDRFELNVAGMYAPKSDVDCGCTLPFSGGAESINIAMEQFELEASIGIRW